MKEAKEIKSNINDFEIYKSCIEWYLEENSDVDAQKVINEWLQEMDCCFQYIYNLLKEKE